jgi:kynurenine formamidase
MVMSVRERAVCVSALVLVGAIGGAAVLAGGLASQATGLSQAEANARPAVTKAEYERWQTEQTNWGRWGKDDQNGALNLITAAKRKQAAGLVRDGVTVSLSQDESTEKSMDNPNPLDWAMLNASQTGAGDRVGWPGVHGAGHTHFDAFAHVFFNGKMWNGQPVAGVVTKEQGAAKGSILDLKNGVVTRGVLFDIPRLKGVEYLEPGTRVFPEDLEAWEKKAGVKIGSGDAFIFRWGRWARRAKLGMYDIGKEQAGLDNSVIPWLKKRDIAILGWESPDYLPRPAGDELGGIALHNFVLTHLGVHILDRANLDALAAAAAQRNRWEFMLTIAPLAIPHGTGSPVNPIAMF